MSAPGYPWAGHASARSRLLEAAIATVSALGYEIVTVEMIVDVAGVGEGDFERSFADKDECCRRAFEDVCDHFDRHLLPVYARTAPAPAKIRAAAYACADYCREYQQRARYGLQVRSRYGRTSRAEQSLKFHLGQMDSLRDEDTAHRIPAAAAELSVGFFAGHAIRLDASGRLGELRASIPSLLYSVYNVYLGRSAAERLLQDEEIRGSQQLPNRSI
ncbi:MAG TPA: TetR/AcrR family transcriptional regulator [Solirubrobacterales bacterium]|nr:TetR/AcrR family transcriptional regulator [Solirubrobacterales bacterium]